ncbi:MAG: gliding motility-associated C-terminal domain-containing protein [Crocinitomicaceae bacterium]|nr:gliding motility-associated C-terminal domain-containing protein [Crocinitomicaceae bacterium]
MKPSVLILLILLANFNINAQIVLYQDVFHGGVSAGGFSTGQGSGTGTFDIHIEPGSTIRKAFLFTYSQRFPSSVEYIINGNSYEFDTTNPIMNVEVNQPPTWYITPARLYCKDITNNIDATELYYNITIPLQLGLEINEGFWSMFLIVLYENPLLPEVNCNILINNKNLIGNEQYAVSNFNPINTNFPVGFSLYTDRTFSGLQPNINTYFNSNYLGKIGGSDGVNWQWQFAGVKGHFYYQNNQLFGLDDDTPDAIMGGTDGLADVSSYIQNNATSCNFQLTHINYPNQPVNATSINLAYFLTYTSPCQPFDVSVAKDTTICQGTTIQLNASGGQSYEWISPTNSTTSNPAPGLSCSNCPNPIFTADSSMFYTVRIWNNDTSTGSACSVVRPVKITVKKPPVLPQLSTVKAQCGVASGSIGIKNPKESGNLYILSENGDTLVKPIVANQNTNQGGLFGGTYTVYFQDAFGCTSGDTTLTIGTINNTIANFTATPQSGSAPLEVTITNTSQNAQQFQWFVNGELQPNPFTSFVADTSGSYQITLVAWKNDPSCADTAQLTVIAYDSLIVGIPNVFSPNNDGVNDNFSITVNQPVKCELVIVNRWGEKVYAYSGNLTVGMNDLWSADATITDGVYFYSVRIETMNVSSYSPNLNQLKKEGFVTVVR